MLQEKFSIEETQGLFLKRHKAFGFKDKSSMVRAAIDHLKKRIELEQLEQSAEYYSEVYSEDDDLKGLTETGIAEWPK